LTDKQAYGTLHGGCGMLLVCHSEKDVLAVISEAAKDGIQAQLVGFTNKVEPSDQKLIIVSQFKNRGTVLTSND
jgi:hypothetical protein